MKAILIWIKEKRGVLRDYLKISFDSLVFSASRKLLSNKVLLVRLDAIGDFVLWLDSGITLTQFYKGQNKEVVLLANSAWASWARELNVFDEVISLDVKSFEKKILFRLNFLKNIRNTGYEKVIHSTYSRTLDADSIVRLSGAIERVGFVGDVSNIRSSIKKASDHWYTTLISTNSSNKMEILRNADFVSKLTHANNYARIVDLRSLIGQSKNVESLLFPINGKEFYILFPGANWSGRQWPIANFSAVAERLYQKTGMIGVVCGGKSDQVLAAAVKRKTTAPIIDLCGQTSLNDLAVIISKAFLLLTNETSAVHMAAAVGTRAFCVLGGGHFGRFSPYDESIQFNNFLTTFIFKKMDCYHCGWNCIYSIKAGESVPCIGEITLESVWSSIDEFIQKSHSS